jgi:hypothetical protein
MQFVKTLSIGVQVTPPKVPLEVKDKGDSGMQITRGKSALEQCYSSRSTGSETDGFTA